MPIICQIQEITPPPPFSIMEMAIDPLTSAVDLFISKSNWHNQVCEYHECIMYIIDY